MSDIINILPDSVANQIAAGEVVDRPASAVKELLENAVDAGATQVQLIIKDAGRTLIQVIDNGCGMSDSDARLCFERHATSKVRQADDLFNIRTMGFRGEALASIAAIAQVELKTRQHDSELGTMVQIEGCSVIAQEPCPCAAGTSLAVKNLFFNVPARRNFLKKDSVELGHIEEVFRRVSLAHCQVSFSMHSNGKLLYDLKEGNLLQRIVQLFGNNYRERFFKVEEMCDLVTVSGYVGRPEFVRKSRGEQYLFVNNRFIKHPGLSTAIEKAYNDLIPERYYPSYFLNLTVDPSRIDVNIHPTKTEVKFIDDQDLFLLLRAAVKKSLGQFCLAPTLDFTQTEAIRDLDTAPPDYVPPQPEISYNTSYNPFDSPSQSDSPSVPSVGGAGFSGFKNSRFTIPDNEDRWKTFFDNDQLPQTASPNGHGNEAVLELSVDESQESNNETAVLSGRRNSCLQLMNRWIVTTMPSGLLLIDQQRAHERILYNKLIQVDRKVVSQPLMFPVNCTFSAADADLLTELLPELRSRGFELAPLGITTFVVTAAPAEVSDVEIQPIFDQLLVEYKGAMLHRHNDADHCLCQSLARQMAVKSGRPLEQEEMLQLVADLFSTTSPEVSPSGLRTMITLSPDKLSDLFK
ncbi:MAG: DNA mismatch repair endonuclease MutL [Bacteroidales bacterium]|nr:DNA mismatch repair endonuclease MutL [Candidatus Colimorpha onthohippi]